MDRDPNYVAVGAFVLLVIAMGVSFVFWYTDQRDKRTYERYEIYFPGTVSGLSAGSPVRYLGVDVGKVVRILIDPQRRNRVEVLADIDSMAPIEGRTRASLSLQGITGLLFIDLQQDRKTTAPAELAQGLHYPVIPSAPSDFDVLLSSLPALTTHLVELVDRVNQVFSDDNVRSFKAALDNARLTSERLPGTIRDVQHMLSVVRSSSNEVE
jgi:phospholipid/cholesterol/gamma-HCH transport system substrate-binding protein